MFIYITEHHTSFLFVTRQAQLEQDSCCHSYYSYYYFYFISMTRTISYGYYSTWSKRSSKFEHANFRKSSPNLIKHPFFFYHGCLVLDLASSQLIMQGVQSGKHENVRSRIEKTLEACSSTKSVSTCCAVSQTSV